MTRRNLLVGAAVAARGGRFSEAVSRIEAATKSGDVWSAAFYVKQREFAFARAFGRAQSPDSVFLLASITKPMTAIGVMILADRGALSLDDKAQKFVPEFKGGDRSLITLRHLLTHTSGLPDMLADNTALRQRHAPIQDFVAGVCRTPLLFKPGTEVRYQSMGILLAAEIVERVARQPLREFLRVNLFEPLGMRNTSLGLGGREISQTVICQVPEPSDWDWNSPYWRDFGAPWGGAHSTAPEVGKLMAAFLHPDGRVLRRETARSMIVNQTPGLNAPWGIGWMVKPGNFGEACSPRTFGHYGATGTVAWADPETDTICVLLTTKPVSQSRDGLLGPVSDAVSRAVKAGLV